MKILVIADVHGNAEALAAVLERERDADTTVFLGDTVLPGPQPNETIELLSGSRLEFVTTRADLAGIPRVVICRRGAADYEPR